MIVPWEHNNIIIVIRLHYYCIVCKWEMRAKVGRSLNFASPMNLVNALEYYCGQERKPFDLLFCFWFRPNKFFY